MCELHISARVRKKKEENERKKNKSAPKYTRVWLVAIMIVCKRTAHSWSVLCPSFFPSTLPARRFTHTLPPTSSAMLFAFFFLFACVRAFVFSFFFSLFFSLVYMRALRLVFFAMRPYSRTRRRESLPLLSFLE